MTIKQMETRIEELDYLTVEFQNEELLKEYNYLLKVKEEIKWL